MALDFDPDVVGLSCQPFRLSWQRDGEDCSHTPDYFARLRDGTGLVIDVRDDNRINPKDAEALAATGRACQSVGWEFRRVEAMEAMRASNLRWLAGYRHPRCKDAGRAGSLRQAFREPLPLMDGARRVGDPDRGAARALSSALDARPSGRFGLRSPVSLVRGGGQRMTVSRPRLLRAGDDILLGGELHTVQAVSAMPLAQMLASPGFATVSSARAPAPLPPSGLLDGIPEAEAEQARWW